MYLQCSIMLWRIRSGPFKRRNRRYLKCIRLHDAEHQILNVENHLDHLRAVLEYMRTNKLDVNVGKLIYVVPQILYYNGDPAKVKAMVNQLILA